MVVEPQRLHLNIFWGRSQQVVGTTCCGCQTLAFLEVSMPWSIGLLGPTCSTACGHFWGTNVRNLPVGEPMHCIAPTCHSVSMRTLCCLASTSLGSSQPIPSLSNRCIQNGRNGLFVCLPADVLIRTPSPRLSLSMPPLCPLGQAPTVEACRSTPKHTENSAQTKILIPSLSTCAVENDSTLVDRCSGCGIQVPDSIPRAVNTMSYMQRQQRSRLTYPPPPFFLSCGVVL